MQNTGRQDYIGVEVRTGLAQGPADTTNTERMESQTAIPMLIRRMVIPSRRRLMPEVGRGFLKSDHREGLEQRVSDMAHQ